MCVITGGEEGEGKTGTVPPHLPPSLSVLIEANTRRAEKGMEGEQGSLLGGWSGGGESPSAEW